MAAATTIVINDGATSPVAHTFTPIGKDDKGVMWFEQTTPAPANPLGAKRIGYRQTRVMDPKGQLTGKSKAILTLYLPTLETVSNNSAGITPPPTVSYVEESRIEFTLPERSVKQERKDTRVLMANLLASAQVVSAVDDLMVIF
ncbi:coat protein [ssRNA phage SRR5466728_3]|uniref:Coat protein n=1 Tax=ssRNA phage SRR5466728_3 TaxID=2786441 RepID=A0A8S5L446_9VIRU|nr:coat protein [ssRNA phage SRR5466728_3]DAD52464.1 TPA_asm: coat protein [ssRNA phage SRR5466728_3]